MNSLDIFFQRTDMLRIAKKQREDDQAKRDANDRDISEYFTKGATKVQPKPKVCGIDCLVSRSFF